MKSFEEITKAIDVAFAAKPFERIAFGSTKNGVSVLYDGAGYDGIYGGFVACAEPDDMKERLTDHWRRVMNTSHMKREV